MSNLVAIAYPDESTAQEVGRTLVELQKEHSIELADLVVAVRQDNDNGGEVLHTSLSTEAEQTLQEALVQGAAAR